MPPQVLSISMRTPTCCRKTNRLLKHVTTKAIVTLHNSQIAVKEIAIVNARRLPQNVNQKQHHLALMEHARLVEIGHP